MRAVPNVVGPLKHVDRRKDSITAITVVALGTQEAQVHNGAPDAPSASNVPSGRSQICLRQRSRQCPISVSLRPLLL